MKLDIHIFRRKQREEAYEASTTSRKAPGTLNVTVQSRRAFTGRKATMSSNRKR